MPRPPRTSTANLSADSAAATTGPDSRPPLPPGWKWATLGEVCELCTGTRDPGQRPDEPFLYVDISSVDNKRKRITEAKRLLGKVAPSRARQVIKTGDVLVATTRPNLNAVALVPPEFNDQIASTGFCVLRNTVEVLPEFLFSFVQTPAFVEALSDLVKGALYPAVTDKQVQGQPIPLPPLAEQLRIVAGLQERLDAVERARAATAAQLADANALPAACLREAFQGVIPLAAGSSSSPAPEKWRWVQLSKLAKLESGHTPSRYHPEWWGGSIPWIALPDIRKLHGKVAVETTECTNEAGIANSSARILPRDTVVLSRTASVGFVTIMGREMATSQDFANWVCRSELDPNFLLYIIMASHDYFRSLASGAVHKTVYMPALKTMEVCIPSLPDQRRIAAELKGKLAGAEALRSSLAAQLADLDALPSAYLRQAFAGEF